MLVCNKLAELMGLADPVTTGFAAVGAVEAAAAVLAPVASAHATLA